MSLKKTVVMTGLLWVPLIGVLHAWLNLDLFRRTEAAGPTFKVGFIPVT
jgi:hypothetical protein